MKDLENKLYPLLRRKQLEIALIPPQRLGVFTPVYKFLVSFLKVAPWRVILLISLLFTFLLRIVLGSNFVVLANILQKSF